MPTDENNAAPDLRSDYAPPLIVETRASRRWRRSLWAIWIVFSVAWCTFAVARVVVVDRERLGELQQIQQERQQCMVANQHREDGAVRNCFGLDDPPPIEIDLDVAFVLFPPIITLAFGAALYRFGAMLRR